MFKASLLTLTLLHPAIVFAADMPAPDTPTTGPAGCMLQVGERLLMVRDIWSQRWGLPGGGQDPGETARQTAERETFEETGLRVVAGAHAWTSPGNFALYHCEPGKEGVPVHADGTLVLPKAGYDELVDARLVDLREIPDAQLRYPSQRTALLAAMEGARGSPESVLRPPPPRGPMFVAELPAIRALQRGIDVVLGRQGSTAAMRVLSQLGSTAAVMLMIVGVWLLVGWRAGVELAYALLLTCLVGLVAKQYFGWPRPFHLDPSLQREAAPSFGFPSVHTVTAAALWGLVAHRVRGAGKLCLALVAACALSRVALGVHYIHDVLAGAVLGAAGVAAYRAHLAFHRSTQVSLTSWRLAALVTGPTAVVLCPQPPTIAVCALLLSFTCGSWLLKRYEGPIGVAPERWSLAPDAGRRAVFAAMVVALSTAVLIFAPRMAPVESSFLPHLYAHILTYLCLGALPSLATAAAHILQRPGACASHVA